MKLLLFVLFVFCSVPAFAQAELPDRGTISDLKGKTKIYINAPTKHLKYIEKEVKKTFTIVSKADDADFVLEYKTLSLMKSGGSLNLDEETGQMDAYFFKDARKVIAWSDSAESGFKDEPNTKLSKRFVKAWKAVK